MATLIANGRTVSATIPTDLSNIGKVLDYAIAREKDSVLFYSGLKNFVLPTAHEHIDIIIHQEERHAAILLKVKEQYGSVKTESELNCF